MKTTTAALLGIFLAPAVFAQPSGQPLHCGAPGYTATYTPEGRGIPPMVDVTFRSKPSSAIAEQALRRCVKEATDKMFITSELMGTVWFGDDAVTLSDGSDHIVYDPKTKRIMTWNEREGTKVALAQANGYFTEYKEEKILVKPYGTFGTLSVVFAKTPTEKVAYETAIAELTKSVQRTGGSKDVTAFVLDGPRDNPAARHQVRGSNGKYIMVEFSAKSHRVTNAAGQVLPVQISRIK